MKKLSKPTNTKETFKIYSKKVLRYDLLIIFIGFAGLYAFLVVQTNNLVQNDPAPSSINTDDQIQPLKLDEDAVETIYELETNNIEIKTLFDQARNNPFNE